MLVLLDLSAAFDTVDHALLLEALEKRFGIHESWYDLDMVPLVSDRTHSDIPRWAGKVNHFRRELQCFPRFGAGPMRFIAYTEDLPAVIEKRSVDPYLYADDGQLNGHLRINDVNALDLCWLCSKLVHVKAPTT